MQNFVISSSRESCRNISPSPLRSQLSETPNSRQMETITESSVKQGTALVGGDGALLYADSRSEICLVEFERFAQKFYAFVHTYLLRVQYITSNIALQY